MPLSVPAPDAEALTRLLPGLSELRDTATGGSGICIALLDGPVDISHPCFEGANLSAVDTLTPYCPTAGSATQHGTHIASILFGQPGSPLHGIAPRCRGILLPIFSDLADGVVRAATQLDLARAILQAVALGANIINVSGGELVPSAEADPYLSNAVRLCTESGVLLVAAAGNDACDCLHVPAALNGTLVVGAMDLDGHPLPESNWPAAYASRGVLAPGQRIPGANVPGGGLAYRSGTSFAAAIVSGVAALLMAGQIGSGRRADARGLAEAILQGATPCNPKDDCRRLFRGRLHIPRTQTILLKGGTITMNGNEQSTGAAPGPQFGETAPLDLGNILPSGNTGEAGAGNGVSPSSGCGCGGSDKSSCSCGGSDKSSCSCGGGVGEKKDSCSCKDEKKKGGCGAMKLPLAYALGRIGYDFGTEARRDSFVQSGLRHPYDPNELLDFLQNNPWASADVIFTLEQDSTPIYAVQGGGPYAALVYERLREFLRDHVSGDAATVSLPSFVAGTASLSNGQSVPILWPNPRGMYSWTRRALLDALTGKEGTNAEENAIAIGNFLDRVSYELRNLGVDPRERALNFTATNAFQIARVYESAIRDALTLDCIAVERSPICRPNSDCWDVCLTFFDPNQRLTRARRIYRFTVDVSDIIPVTVGTVRHWDVF